MSPLKWLLHLSTKGVASCPDAYCKECLIKIECIRWKEVKGTPMYFPSEIKKFKKQQAKEKIREMLGGEDE